MTTSARFLLVLMGVASGPGMAHSLAAEPSAALSMEQEAFFETTIRPLLVKHCHQCHGPQTQEAGLRLDSKEAMLRGSETGPVLIAGQPKRSRLIAAIRYDGDVQMPPDYKLAQKDYQALVTWIKTGAYWPEGKGANVATADSSQSGELSQQIEAARRRHWAYQPIRKPDLPGVQNEAWCRTAIDHFIAAAHQRHGLEPSPQVDRRTLLRRLSFDLVGLPPTYEEVEAFAADSSPAAVEKVVDRLLASPYYGERWGRHWLDIARYSDTKGYVFQEEPRYPFAFTYRDYVVQAFNADLPFDQFIVEQLAADQLPPRDDNISLAAMGFLTVGRRFSNNQHDIIDDRIDVVTRGLLGLTVACARCHDHKYDPVPTADYYSLYGVFNSSVEPAELPVIGKPQEGPEYEKFKQQLAERQKELDAFLAKEIADLREEFRTRIGDYLAHVVAEKLDRSGDVYVSLSRGDPRPRMVRRWHEYLERKQAKPDAVFGLWHEFVALNGADFAADAAKIVEQLKADSANVATSLPVNPRLRKAVISEPPKSLSDVVRLYEKVFAAVRSEWDAAVKQAEEASQPPPAALADPALDELRQVLDGNDSPLAFSDEEAVALFDRQTRNKHGELKKKIGAFLANSPTAPPRAMIMTDADRPTNPRVFLRGNAARPGPEVPRQFLEILAGSNRKPFTNGSGRLELAQAIASPDNPLTARVIVNRIWQQHFGSGLVTTASDFGARSDPPSHPKLLDYLAATFIEQGWSLKTLHRQIVLSSVYQQQSGDRPEARRLDPENRWLWRTNRRRLELEPMRDAILATSGQLDRTLGGRPVEIAKPPYSTRRTLYGLIDRQVLPDMFRVFDFASPDVSTEVRPTTTVPQQALFAMNSPFVLEQVKHLAARKEVVEAAEPDQRIKALYRIVLARDPRPEEIDAGLRFIESRPEPAPDDKNLSPWEMYAQVLLLTNEFLFVD